MSITPDPAADRPPDDFDWSERACPLPVIRKEYDEDTDEYRILIERCGEQLYVTVEDSKYLLKGGPCDSCGPTWKVECLGGHVLLLPDHGGDDNFWEIPFDLGQANEALSQIGGPGGGRDGD
jgi:hypothetical protein